MGSMLAVAAALGLAAAGATAEGTAAPVVIEEHPMVVVDEQAPRVKAVDEGLEEEPEWDWPRKHLAAGEPFVDPFLATEVYPEVSAQLAVSAAHLRPDGEVGFGSRLDLSLYLLDIRLPLIGSSDGQTSEGNVQLALKIPFAWPGSEVNRFALVWGATIPQDGPTFSESSRFDLHYALGVGTFSAQLRVGYGWEQAFEAEPLRQGLLYGALLSFGTGVIQPLLELDAARYTTTRSDRWTLVPGVRLQPAASEGRLQLGLGALIGLSDGDGAPAERWGGIVDLSYNFL